MSISHRTNFFCGCPLLRLSYRESISTVTSHLTLTWNTIDGQLRSKLEQHGKAMNFYRKAADILDDFKTKKGGSIKSLIFQQKAKTSSPADQKRLYALVSETLKSSCSIMRGWENRQICSWKGYRELAAPQNRTKGVLLGFLVTDFRRRYRSLLRWFWFMICCVRRRE